MKRLRKSRPELRKRIDRALQLLAENPFNPELRTHRLQGELNGLWVCAVDYSYRLLFEFVRDAVSGEDVIVLLALGTHDEVY